MQSYYQYQVLVTDDLMGVSLTLVSREIVLKIVVSAYMETP